MIDAILLALLAGLFFWIGFLYGKVYGRIEGANEAFESFNDDLDYLLETIEENKKRE